MFMNWMPPATTRWDIRESGRSGALCTATWRNTKVYIIDRFTCLVPLPSTRFLKRWKSLPNTPVYFSHNRKHKIIPTILSAAVHLTSTAIKTEDISNHLAYMAKTNRSPSEQEALACDDCTKADGGLRDACSILIRWWPLPATTSPKTGGGETWTCWITIITSGWLDSFCHSNAFRRVITFDDILRKRIWQPSHFNWFGRTCFRNLLVSGPSLSLLEISESLKQRYTQQANRLRVLFPYTSNQIL